MAGIPDRPRALNRAVTALVLLNPSPGCTRSRYENCVLHGQTMFKLPRDVFDTFYPMLRPESVTYVYRRESTMIHILVECSDETRKRKIGRVLTQLEEWFMDELTLLQGQLLADNSGTRITRIDNKNNGFIE